MIARRSRASRPRGGLLQRLVARLRGVTVHALVGASGTGKSFRARLIAEREDIDLVVDDGLLIEHGSLAGGRWAKKERTLLAATRRALFDSPEDAAAAQAVLRKVRPRAVLILGTSEEMARRISRALRLPAPRRIHRIEDVASRKEIEQALRARGRARSHSLAVPAVDIRRGALRELASRVLDALAPLAGGGREPAVAGAAPTRGRVLYTEAALLQLVTHCARDFDAGVRVTGVRVKRRGRWLLVDASVQLPRRLPGGRLHELRESILGCLERHVGLPIRELSLVIDGMAAG